MKLTYLLSELWLFTRKQASCAIFGGLMLFFLIATRYVSIPGIHRYDLLFIIAIITQIILIATKLETPREVGVIIIFHISAMVMELFKTSSMVGSWTYPEPAFFAISTVPLFTGFMYSAVGSYIARAWRINKFRFEHLPSRLTLFLLGLLIYINFFSNHFIADMRLPIFMLAVIIFWRTKFYVTLTDKTYRIHPLIANALSAFIIWLSEQIGTFARVWIYPDQLESWVPVSFHMLTSWYMLLIFSFILISLLYKKEIAHFGKH